MTKYSRHLTAIGLLEIGETYLIECRKSDIKAIIGIYQRKQFKGKVFTSACYTCVPASFVQEPIYAIRVLRKV